MKVPAHWQMWTITKWPDGLDGLPYSARVGTKLGGHVVEVVGIGETIDQAITEAERAEKDLRKRISK